MIQFDDVLDKEKRETKAVHHLHEGKTPCSMTKDHGPPFNWPLGHVWSQRWPDVTCVDCLAAKPEEEKVAQ